MAVHFIDRQQQVVELLPKLMAVTDWGMDTETTGLDPLVDKVIAMQFGTPHDQYIIDTRQVKLDPLQPFFDSKAHKKIFHNATFDWAMVWKSLGIDIEAIRCTMFAEQLLNVGRQNRGFSLEDVLFRRLGIKIDKTQQTSFIGHTGAFTKEQIDYMGVDVQYLVPMCKSQCDDLVLDGVGPTWRLECEAIAPFTTMGLNGFKLDTELWQKTAKDKAEEAVAVRAQMDLFAKDFWETDNFGRVRINYDSPIQVVDLLRRMRVRIPTQVNGVTEMKKVESSKNDFLKLIKDVPFVNLLQKYRSLAKAVSTYGDSFIKKINPITGKLHFEVKQLGTETGRPASRKGSPYNPLNIPREKCYRHAFIADDDYVIETDDLSGCELRIWAEVSKDPGLCEAFLSGQDVHSYVATKIFKVPVSKKENSHWRQLVKPINFGIAYSMGPGTLYNRVIGEGLEITFADLKKIYDQYTKSEFKTGVEYLRKKGKDTVAMAEPMAKTIGGRRRYWIKPNPLDKNLFPMGREDQKYRGILAKMAREAGNMEIQGTNADMIKRSMRLIHDVIKERGFRTTFKNMVYDELVTMTHKDDSAEFVEIKRKLMLDAAHEYLKVIPMEVEGEVMRSWTK